MVPVATPPRFDLRQVAVHASHLSPAPRLLGRLLAALENGEASVRFLADLARSDGPIASHLIQVANGPGYGGHGPAHGVEEAVWRIGMGDIQRVLRLAAAARVFGVDLGLYDATAAMLWANAAVTSIAAEFLAERTGHDPAQTATAGLLRSAGKMLLAHHAAGISGPVSVAASGRSLPAWELDSFGVTHAEVGAGLCEAWRFPRAVGLALRHHLAPVGLSSPAGLVHAAAGVAVELGYGLPGELDLWTSGGVARPSDGDGAGVAGRTAEVFGRLNGVFVPHRG